MQHILHVVLVDGKENRRPNQSYCKTDIPMVKNACKVILRTLE